MLRHLTYSNCLPPIIPRRINVRINYSNNATFGPLFNLAQNSANPRRYCRLRKIDNMEELLQNFPHAINTKQKKRPPATYAPCAPVAPISRPDLIETKISLPGAPAAGYASEST
jgi:hypothetical protein